MSHDCSAALPVTMPHTPAFSLSIPEHPSQHSSSSSADQIVVVCSTELRRRCRRIGTSSCSTGTASQLARHVPNGWDYNAAAFCSISSIELSNHKSRTIMQNQRMA